MLPVSSNLIAKMKEISTNLQSSYTQTNADKKRVRKQLQLAGATFHQMERFLKNELIDWLNGRNVAAVDGSVNQTDGDFPHILYMFQALAKTTTGIQCLTTDLYTPLLESKEIDEGGSHWRAHILSKLELQAASQLIDEANIAILLMDGALFHYRIDAPDDWEHLREKALEKDVLLVGVSEEITTENLITLEPFKKDKKRTNYDRDLLFGVLKEKEIVYVEKVQHKEGLQSVWMRLSTDPSIAGFDMLEEQADAMVQVGRLLLSLTPEDGRGIPLWLDHVDREVRITDKIVTALVEQYVDPDIRQRFFSRKRLDRPY